MLDVVNDCGVDAERQFAAATIAGSSLEDRLYEALDVLATYYDQSRYLVQLQILLDLSTNPKLPSRVRRAVRREDGEEFDSLAEPLLRKALNEIADERDLVLYAFMTMRGYLLSSAASRLISKLPEGAVVRLIGGAADEETLRRHLIRGIGATIREEARLRGYSTG